MTITEITCRNSGIDQIPLFRYFGNSRRIANFSAIFVPVFGPTTVDGLRLNQLSAFTEMKASKWA